MNRSFSLLGVAALSLSLTLAGCSSDTAKDEGSAVTTSAAKTPAAPPSPELQPLVVKADPPPQEIGVAMARDSAEPGQDVVVEGRLKDFVDGKAAFTMVDGSIKSCIEEGDGCPTPWDYCCVAPTKLAKNTATVKLVDESGKMLDGNLQGVNSIDNLSTVVVTGKVEKDESGNLTIAANKVFLR